ncbi:MAG: RHS repeat-associated core domain-containing protein, partial [Pedobacter sp.]
MLSHKKISWYKYTYEANTNKLVSVLENAAGSPTLGFKDGATAATEYDYDEYGNMTGDLNKGIPFTVGSGKGIVYNHLGLPLKVTYATGTVEYTYDAGGTRMKKVITSGSTIETTDYLYGWQYKNSVLQFFPTSEGYVKNTLVGTVNNYNYVFQYKDHLGNVRISYGINNAGVLKIMEENNYYPFGMKHDNYNTQTYAFTISGSTSDLTAATPDNQYKFGGKELQPELGFYDFSARNYDPALGRWMNIDPMAETSTRWSPYVYTQNNPVYFTDPDGKQIQPMDSKGRNLYGPDGWYLPSWQRAPASKDPADRVTILKDN